MRRLLARDSDVGEERPTKRQRLLDEMNQALARQAEFCEQHELWKRVQRGDAEGLKTLVRDDATVLRAEGAVGEQPLHLLLLFEHFELAKWVIETDDKLVMARYGGEIFTGESCLHMAVVKGNEEMVRLLLQTAQRHDELALKRLLDFPVEGRFFAKGQPCYFGEHALGFAVSTNQENMVKLLVEEFGDDLMKVDSHGNTVLHLAVEHRLPSMAKFLIDLWKVWSECDANRHARGRQLTAIKNEERLTPICAAAKSGYRDMFDTLLRKSCITHWTYGPVKCTWLPLSGIVSEKHTKPEQDGCIEEDCALKHIIDENHVELLMGPLMQELLEQKWTKFAGHYFTEGFLVALVQAVLFSIMVVLPHPEWGAYCRDLGWLCRWGLHWLCRCSVLCLTARKVNIEVEEMRNQGGFEAHFAPSGPGFFENLTSACFCSSFLALQVLDLADSSWADTMVAFCALSCWSYLLWFLRGFRSTGKLIIMMYKILVDDIEQFFRVTSVFVLAFSLASFAVTTPMSERGFGTFGMQLVQSFHGLLNGVDQDQLASFHDQGRCNRTALGADPCSGSEVAAEARHTVFVVLLMVVYSLLGTTLLLNILVAMMNSTFENVSKVAEKRWNMERACIISAIESELQDQSTDFLQRCLHWLLRGNEPKDCAFYVEVDGERYLQIQEEASAY